MSRAAKLSLPAIVIALGIGAACGPRAAPQPAAPPHRDLVVLAVDPDSGEVGVLDVTAAGQSVALTTAGASTTASRPCVACATGSPDSPRSS